MKRFAWLMVLALGGCAAPPEPSPRACQEEACQDVASYSLASPAPKVFTVAEVVLKNGRKISFESFVWSDDRQGYVGVAADSGDTWVLKFPAAWGPKAILSPKAQQRLKGIF